MTDRRTVAWNAAKLAILKKAYADHKGEGVIEITVAPEGKLEFLPAYAKYLIEYLESQFSRPARASRPSNEGEESYTTGSGSWEGAVS